MKILILSQYYPPETGAPQVRLHSLARNLMDYGVEVEVLSAMPNYPKNEIFKEYIGLRKKEEVIDGVRVVRRSIYVSKKAGIIRRLMNYFSFVWSSMWSSRSFKEVDFILCESPPLFLGISAIYLSKKLNAKLVFNVSDLWPESAEKLNVVTNRMLLSLAYTLEGYLYRKSVLVTCQTKGIVRNIIERFPKVNAHWMPNGIDPRHYSSSTFDTDLLEAYNLNGKDIYIYAGILGHAQGLEVIIRAKNYLDETFPDKVKSLVFVLVGDGPDLESLKQLDMKLATHCVFIPNQPKSKVVDLVAQCKGYIIPLKRIPLFMGAIPSKIFDPLALGKPILLGVDGEARDLFIEQGQAGIYFEPENFQALAQAVMCIQENPELSTQMGVAGRLFAKEYFDNRNIAQGLKAELDAVMGKS